MPFSFDLSISPLVSYSVNQSRKSIPGSGLFKRHDVMLFFLAFLIYVLHRTIGSLPYQRVFDDVQLTAAV